MEQVPPDCIFMERWSQPRYKDSVSNWSESNWHHINVGFHADGSLSLQVDGVNKSMSYPVDSILSSTRDLLLGGAHHESEKWNGAFDEVRISMWYAQQTGPRPSTTIRRVPKAWLITDQSGLHHHLPLLGFVPLIVPSVIP